MAFFVWQYFSSSIDFGIPSTSSNDSTISATSSETAFDPMKLANTLNEIDVNFDLPSNSGVCPNSDVSKSDSGMMGLEIERKNKGSSDVKILQNPIDPLNTCKSLFELEELEL